MTPTTTAAFHHGHRSAHPPRPRRGRLSAAALSGTAGAVPSAWVALATLRDLRDVSSSYGTGRATLGADPTSVAVQDMVLHTAGVASLAVASLVCAYVAVVAAANLLASLTPGGPGRTLSRLTPRLVSGVTAGVVALSSCSAAQGVPAEPPDPAITMEVVGPADSGGPPGDGAVSTARPPTSAASPTVTTPAEGRTDTTDPTDEAEPTVPNDPAAPTTPARPDTHTVVPGDHLWSIAESIVGAGSADDAVADYWRRLIAVNRDRLVDPSDPDLIVPGQQLVLP